MDDTQFKNETLRVVIVGHVDHGKSTLIGRLIYELDQIQDGRYEELKEVSEKRGMTFEWAFLMDALQTERDQGITIDTTQIFFKTKKRNYVFVDAPGHKEFLRNMITGASSADIALLIIDAEEGVKEQTKKHAYLLKLLGISKVIVVMNKMDKIKYNQVKFNLVKIDIVEYLNLLNINAQIIIPISARDGENINNKSKKMKWYKGFDVVKALDNYKVSNLSSFAPLRLPVQDIYKLGDKRIIVGRIESGKIKNNDEIFFSPSNTKAKIKNIELWNSKRKIANVNECVGFTLDQEIFVERGDIVSFEETAPKLVNTFEANIFWLSSNALNLENKYTIKLTTAKHEIIFEKINKIIDTDDLSKKKSNEVSRNDVAEVTLSSQVLIPVDNFNDNPSTSRFSIIDGFEVVGGGIINAENYPNQRKLINKSIKNIIPTSSKISEVDRSAKQKHRPGIIWFTGLSGSGKSTIAREVEKRMFSKGFNVFILDGDNLRSGLNKDLSFSPEDRMENIRRTAEVAALFSSAGFLVITSLISPYKSERKKARMIRPEIFREIYIKASLEICMQRDIKGLYAKAKAGQIKNFTGLTSPYEAPDNPDLILETENKTIEKTIDELEKYIIAEFGII
ncbi:adenylyl-sulfate kinase [Rickettsiales bacterium]|nr:adenylyl-sulfate kinase [Rickettsiales bacterium]